MIVMIIAMMMVVVVIITIIIDFSNTFMLTMVRSVSFGSCKMCSTWGGPDYDEDDDNDNDDDNGDADIGCGDYQDDHPFQPPVPR